MKEQLENFKKLSFTADLWPNTKMASFLGVTTHYLDLTDFTLQNVVLARKEVVDSHTGEHLVE